MLCSSSSYSSNNIEKKRLFLDSCILNDMATSEVVANVLNELNDQYVYIYCTVSVTEVGFGPRDVASQKQINLTRTILRSEELIPVSTFDVHNHDASSAKNLIYNPTVMEWFASRNLLINVMESTGKGGSKVRGLANDALIYSCAWNSESSLITNNVKDFMLFNRLQKPQVNGNGHVCHLPIFSFDDLFESIDKEVSYPENVYQYM